MASALVVQGLSKSFGALRAVENVSLDVAPNQVHSLIGPNGAGKTTAFNCISGFLRPDVGRIWLNGQEVTRWPPHRLASAGMARTFQITKIFSELSVLENVALAARSRDGRNLQMWRRANHCAAKEQAEEVLRTLALSARTDSSAGQLAHGEKRVLEIGIALALRPAVLLLDEPTAGMSSRESEHIAALIRKLSSRVSVLLVEHDMEIVLGISDVVTVMTQGRIIASGSPAQITRDPEVQAAYLGTAEPEFVS
ncbi:MAG: ABC transporter ATP-binding protein [Betaproteobacteria bacterium]|nr:MAG: ABC transporter ATP-binding protein [Betaproteobacteria bacterium]